MGLFPKDVLIDETFSGTAPRRMFWTRELGTRKLLIGLAIIAGLWYLIAQAYDRSLLQRHWPALAPSGSGMTLVGTLNSRDSYDRNILKIITTNKSSRVVITEFGWKAIFDERNGPLFTDRVGNTIKEALTQDDVTGYAMLSPFLRATFNKQLGDPTAYKEVRAELPVHIEKHTASGSEELTTLGSLLTRFDSERGPVNTDAKELPEGGSASGREQEKVITIPAETLIQICPVILTEHQCEGASLEEVQGNLLTPTTYTIHINLSPEGRSRFFQWSHDHENENVVFALNGQVIAAPRITQSLNVSDFAISNVQDVKAARALVTYMNSHISR